MSSDKLETNCFPGDRQYGPMSTDNDKWYPRLRDFGKFYFENK